MFDWLKRRAKEPATAPVDNGYLKQLTKHADELREAGQLADARRCYDEVLRADPGDLYVAYHLAGVLQQLGALAEARRICEQGLALDPDQVGLLARHAGICRKSNDFLTALAGYQRIRQLAPDFSGIDAHLADAFWHVGRGREAVEAFDRALERDPDVPSLQSDRLFNLNYFTLLDREALFEEHRKWGVAHEAKLSPSWRPWENDRSSDRKLRVGYVSPDLRDHAVAYFIDGVLREHDRAAFEIHCFDVSPFPEDHVTARLRPSVDAWHRVGALDDDAVAGAIRGARIDILVDLSGHTGHNRLLVFARKPAPVQVSWFGYMNTTGLTAIDYRITDPYLDPPGESERFYTETLFRIPSMACFTPALASPPVSPLPALGSNVFTFASVNQWTKVTDEVKDIWASILRESDGFRLLIHARGAENPRLRTAIVEEFVQRGAAAAQVAVFPTRPMADFLEMFGEIDVVLDPFPYGGGTTTLHALWMGVPVITLEGGSEMSRSSSGILRAAGHPEFVVSNPDDYRRLALDMGRNPKRVAEVRAGLRERMRLSSLMDHVGLTRNLERAYQFMWHNYCIGSKAILMLRQS